ncbi:MAG TPA: response regulator [Thermoanaerobaculia bacterium]|nr:response regulator [Thermoanaerobaculia bacterium]
MSHLTIEILGGFSCSVATGKPLSLPTRKGEALLAFLALQPGTFHSREKLASLLWGDTGEEQARQSLRQTLFGIRKALGDDSDQIIRVETDRLSLASNLVEVDALRFLDLVNQPTIQQLQEAVSLYKGELLEGFNVNEEAFEEWVSSERDRLREKALVAYGKFLDLLTEADRLDEAVQAALRMVSLDPLRESAHRSLMRLYMKQRRPDAALRQFQNCAEAVRRRLGVEPEHETKKLHEEILRLRNAPDLKEAGGAPGESKSGQISVLLVEDNALNRELVRAILNEQHYAVTIAEDGAQALIQMGKKTFNLILLDANLPNVDGMTFLEVMKQNAFSTPVILMTAMPGDEVEIKAFELGAVDFIRKPVQKAVLVKRIEKALRDSGS